MKYGNVLWEYVAKSLESKKIVKVNWEDEFFICPSCKQSITKKFWYYFPIEYKRNKTYFYCPICGHKLGKEIKKL